MASDEWLRSLAEVTPYPTPVGSGRVRVVNLAITMLETGDIYALRAGIAAQE